MKTKTQRQSYLFRIPREIRDEIYNYYARDDDGLFYDYASGKLRYADKAKQQDRLGLSCSCKIAAGEMQDTAIWVNTITFVPARSDNDGAKRNRLRCKAIRFERLLQASRRMKIHILHHVAKGGCVTDQVVDQVAERYPCIARYYRFAFAAIKAGGYGFESWQTLDYMERWQMPAAFCDAIDDTLELASSHPVFEDLASKACSTPLSKQGFSTPFIPGSHSALLRWRPNWWLIPDEDDLFLESFLTEPCPEDYTDEAAWPEPLAPVAWNFSATAVAIDFLKRLSRSKRMKISEKIIIQEDKNSVAHPECHARGLVPFCCENPKTRIELHVGAWTSLTPSVWLESPTHYDTPGSNDTLQVLGSFAEWMDEIVSLPRLGMPANAITAILEGQTRETLQLWTMIKHAAGLQEDLEGSHFLRHYHKIVLDSIIVELNMFTAESWAAKRFKLPRDLPPVLSSAILQTIRERHNPIRQRF